MSFLTGGNASLLTAGQVALLDALVSEGGQGHLFASWPAKGEGDEDKLALVRQLEDLESKLGEGGILGYVGRSKKLLKDQKEGVNPFEGFVPEVPTGFTLERNEDGDGVFGKELCDMAVAGAEQAKRSAFVLVAGGLGERLGYSGIKVALPCESVTGSAFLKLYIESILAIQALDSAGEEQVELPLAIMTSDDTHQKTLDLLVDNDYFGMSKSQVHLIKQDKVPCLTNNEAHVALSSPSKVMTKPHGHGDVHMLLHTSGLVKSWCEMGIKFVCFFQDTNALVFRGLLASLGISATHGLHVNSLCVPRKAKEAIGAICKLKKGAEEMTLNVEYNQLDPLLRATTNPEGDVNDPATGLSPFPGNLNQLIISCGDYQKQLASTHGRVPEFVNPKYVPDTNKEVFKSPTRLECMMQDYPRTLPAEAKVGFTVLKVATAYSPVKNAAKDALAKFRGGNPSHSATSGELDIYAANCAILKHAGVSVGAAVPVCFNGMDMKLSPSVAWNPSFLVSVAQAKAKFPGAGKVEISSSSTLCIEGEGVTVAALKLDGALVIRAARGAKVTVSGLSVSNKGWEFKPIEQVEDVSSLTEVDKMKGFVVVKHETKELVFDKPGEYDI